jgi:selenoprotein W-related protein
MLYAVPAAPGSCAPREARRAQLVLLQLGEARVPKAPIVEITYCRLCGWGMRAGWMAQELMATFPEELGSVILTPDVSGGLFEVRVEGELIWSRKDVGRFPEIKEIKRLVRDHIAPHRALGHTDKE